MWVYRSGHLYHERQIVLYEYRQTRNASHPREFLKGYGGICVTDGYQVYHTLEKELEELTAICAEQRPLVRLPAATRRSTTATLIKVFR